MLNALPFGELETLARAFLAVFLALVAAWVASQKPEFFQSGAQFHVKLAQSAGDSVTRGAGLSGNTAAIHQHQDIEFISRLRRQERLPNRCAGRLSRKIRFERPSVNRKIPFAGAQKNTGYRFLAAPGTEILNDACCH